MKPCQEVVSQVKSLHAVKHLEGMDLGHAWGSFRDKQTCYCCPLWLGIHHFAASENTSIPQLSLVAMICKRLYVTESRITQLYKSKCKYECVLNLGAELSHYGINPV